MENQQGQRQAVDNLPSPEAPGANPPSPTLNPAHQHHDAHHVRESINAEKPAIGGTVTERGLSDTSHRIQSSTEKPIVENLSDVEGGQAVEEGSRRNIWARYKKEIRLAIHLAIWILFTG